MEKAVTMAIASPIVDFSEVEIERFIHASEDYLLQYKALIKLGAAVQNAEEAVALALAVYGWMPTILRSVEVSDEQIERVKRANDIESGIQVIRGFGSPPVNNSWVGSSKFLHFLNPQVFPIWDSHIARAFGLARRDQYESSAHYISYMDAMRKLLPVSADSISQTTGRISIQFGYDVSPLRALEFLIFSNSRNGRKNQL
jgi:hypothetical protein